MAVLVLEAGRSRTEDLNEKLRRLSLITAEAAQSLRVDEVVQSVLFHLVESLGGSHGFVFLADGSKHPPALTCRASVGFGARFHQQSPRISADESWLRSLLLQERPLAFPPHTKNVLVHSWMETEKLVSLTLVRIPGKEEPLGFLGIGSPAPRDFEREEQDFLVNVANLLGLTAQNVALFQNAAAARRQWLDTFDSIDDLILVHSVDGTILRANRALADRLRIEPAVLVGRSVRDALHSSGFAWSRCPYCEGAAGKADEVDPSFGGYFLASDSSLHDSEGGNLGTIHVLKDLTGEAYSFPPRTAASWILMRRSSVFLDMRATTNCFR
jgi:GAF domain-containing protein